jgi:hypothetical protein
MVHPASRRREGYGFYRDAPREAAGSTIGSSCLQVVSGDDPGEQCFCQGRHLEGLGNSSRIRSRAGNESSQSRRQQRGNCQRHQNFAQREAARSALTLLGGR